MRARKTEQNNKINLSPFSLFFPFVLFILVCLPVASPSADESTVKKEIAQQKNPCTKATISGTIIPAANMTFRLDVILYGQPLALQPNVPGLPGHDGLAAWEKAQRVAEFVLKKIRKNETPPTVIIEDSTRWLYGTIASLDVHNRQVLFI